MIAVGPAIPISRRSQMGVPVGVQASLKLALAQGNYDVVHGFEPGLPSLSYLALRDTDALAVATFASPDRLGYPPARSQREKLLGRLDALIALSDTVRDAAEERFPGDYQVLSPGVDTTLFAAGPKQQTIVVELRPNEREVARGILHARARSPRLGGGPPPHPSADRTARDPARARRACAPAHRPRGGCPRGDSQPGRDLRARCRRAPSCHPRGGGLGLRDRPPARRAGTARARRSRRRLAWPRTTSTANARVRRHAPTPSCTPSTSVAAELDSIYTTLGKRRRKRKPTEPLSDRPFIVADLHMHTSWSHDCSIDATELVDHAEAEGLGAIAVTDHNVFGGALEAADYAQWPRPHRHPWRGGQDRRSGRGDRAVPRAGDPAGMSFAETVAAIRRQGGLVYVPHPFDRLHAIPDPRTLHRNIAEIDVLEVYNARLLFEAFNDEALRFARKYNLTMGAGSDAHVLQGVGTGALRMRAFRDPEEFMISLRSAEVLRRPKSLAYLQSLKWVAQVKEKVR